MKKISLFTLSVFASLIMYAQSEPQLRTPMAIKTRFGLKGGVNLATLNANDYPTGSEPSITGKTSFNGGVFANIPLSTMFRLQPELVYSRQGSKMSQKVGTTTQNYEQELSYITLPVMLQLQSTSGFFVETGPQAGYLIKAKQDGPGSTSSENKSSFDKFDFSWGAGLGYLSRIGLGINARYNFGLTNTIEDSNNSSNNGPELKNRVIQVGLVYQFGAYK